MVGYQNQQDVCKENIMPFLFGKVNGLIAKVTLIWETIRKQKGQKKVVAKEIIKRNLKKTIRELEELN
jgi:hypothetical protein